MEHWPCCAQDAETETRSARIGRLVNTHTCKAFEMPRKDFCVGCNRKRKCVRPYAEEAAKVYPAACTAEPSLLLLPHVRNAVDHFADDPVYSTELRDQRIDANEAVGTVNHMKRVRLLEWGSVTGRLRKARWGR